MNDEKLKQLFASALLELNRFNTQQKNLTRKEKTHKKVVLGAGLAKFLGLDFEYAVLVGYLMRSKYQTEHDIEKMRLDGERELELSQFRRYQKRSTVIRKKSPLENKDKEEGKSTEVNLTYNDFTTRLSRNKGE